MYQTGEHMIDTERTVRESSSTRHKTNNAEASWICEIEADYLMPPIKPNTLWYLEMMTDKQNFFVKPDPQDEQQGGYYVHSVSFLVLICIDQEAQVYECVGIGMQYENFDGMFTHSTVEKLRWEVLAHASSGNIFGGVEEDTIVSII